MHGRLIINNDINSISKVNDKKHAAGGQNVLNKSTLTSVCWVLSRQHRSPPGSRCFLWCQFWHRRGYKQVFVMGTLGNLVLRGKCWAWQETLNCTELCWVQGLHPPSFGSKTQRRLDTSAQSFVCLNLHVSMCTGITVCVSVQIEGFARVVG